MTLEHGSIEAALELAEQKRPGSPSNRRGFDLNSSGLDLAAFQRVLRGARVFDKLGEDSARLLHDELVAQKMRKPGSLDMSGSFSSFLVTLTEFREALNTAYAE